METWEISKELAEALFPPPQVPETQEEEPADTEFDKADSSIDEEQMPQEHESAPSSEDGEEPAASEENEGTLSSSPEPDSEQTGEEGAEEPIQGEPEDIEEVAEATSKTSEDVHGGDEATKDIEDSPNAADDGEAENEGAETGEDGEDGESDSHSGQQDSANEGTEGEGDRGEADGDSDCESEGQSKEENTTETEGDNDGEGGDEGEGADADSSDAGSTGELAAEEWEVKVDQCIASAALEKSMRELEEKVRDEAGHRTTLPRYDFGEESPVELEVAFRKSSELLRKFAAEEDFASRKDGSSRWDAKAIAKSVVAYRHQNIPSSKSERPKEADICILLDISGSCESQAEMFMAIAAGVIGSGVRVFVGYNGCARASAMNPPKRRITSYAKAKPWVQSEIDRVSGWDNQEAVGEWGFSEFLEEVRPKTVIIFGDWDGIDLYTDAVRNPKFRKVKFFWFANEGVREEGRIPDGFTRKNYVPGIYTPRDFVRALRTIR